MELKRFFAILSSYGAQEGDFIQVYPETLKRRFAGAADAALGFCWPFTG